MTPQKLADFYRGFYAGAKVISVDDAPHSFLGANHLAGSNRMEFFIGGNAEQLLLCSRFDNLGKGASGSAIQNMNLVLGFCEDEGLKLKGTAKSGPGL